MVFRGFLWIPRILTELRSEKFEWFGPSPIEPFNLGHDTESEEEIQGEIVDLLGQKATRKKKKIRAVNWAAINFSKPMRDRENAWLRQVPSNTHFEIARQNFDEI